MCQNIKNPSHSCIISFTKYFYDLFNVSFLFFFLIGGRREGVEYNRYYELRLACSIFSFFFFSFKKECKPAYNEQILVYIINTSPTNKQETCHNIKYSFYSYFVERIISSKFLSNPRLRYTDAHDLGRGKLVNRAKETGVHFNRQKCYNVIICVTYLHFFFFSVYCRFWQILQYNNSG